LSDSLERKGTTAAESVAAASASHTPRTDAEIAKISYDTCVMEGYEFARQLERENNDLLTACELAEQMLRDGGTFPVRGQTWLVLQTTIKKALGR
jgi:hypothetical protein